MAAVAVAWHAARPGAAMPAHLILLGTPSIAHGDATRALPFERRTQLLAYLALKAGWVGRAEIAALLWPEQEAKLAYTNLRKALHRLPALAAGVDVQAEGNALRVGVDTDVGAFESALRDGRIADALALWRGDLLRGFDEDANEAWTGWLRFERDRLRGAWRSAASEYLAGDPPVRDAIALAARLVEADPLDEGALRLHLQALVRGGQVAHARQVHREFADRLQRELALAPGPALAAVFEAPGASRSPDRTAAAPRPAAAADGFVGRAVELRRVSGLLAQDDCRLLCLSGPGGVGKTRFAQRIVAELGDRFEDGATFVALDDLSSAQEIGARLLRELGVVAKARVEAGDQAVETLRAMQKLLVLDNFEHVIDGAPLVERLIAQCPRVRIVVTSRIRLALPSEWLFPLEGLPWPDAEDRDRIEDFDAVRLFAGVARRMRPDFSAANEAVAVIDICQQVEGLPLALELAASWTRLLSCEAIAKELREGRELLRSEDGVRPARHASIEAVFEQSWRLLSDIERDVLARLSVMSGSFTAEAARDVAFARLAVLASLADKSLLHRDDARLRLHPLVQQLAGAKLPADAAFAAHAAHAAHYLNLLHQLKPGLRVMGPEALEVIDSDYENCRQAWHFAVETGEGAALRQSVPALVGYFEDRARFAEGRALLAGAIESSLAERDPALKALLVGQAALIELRLARYAEADAMAADALAIGRHSGDPGIRFRALSVRAGCAVNTGRLADAKRWYSEALAVARRTGALADVAPTLENIALVEKRLGRYDEALRMSSEAIDRYRAHGDVARLAVGLSNLGSLHLFLGRTGPGKAALEEALRLAERHDLVSTKAYALANLVELALKERDRSRAQELADRALGMTEAAGMRALAGWLELQRARLAAWRGDLAQAHALLSKGAALASALDAPSLKAAAIIACADVLHALGEPASAQHVLAFGMAQDAISAPDREELRQAWEGLGSDPLPATWPVASLDDLMRRLADEAALAHAPLVAALRSAN